MKILLAVDGSEYTRRMLDYIASHNDLFDAAHQYTALTVVPSVPPRVTSYIARSSLDEYYGEQAEAVLKPVRDRAQQLGWKLDPVHQIGHAADVIARYANDGKFDLLVMGSHGHAPMTSLMLGSVAARVLAHCTTPVLIVR
jgi:nucleotide-binding universal stress UspA family protein